VVGENVTNYLFQKLEVNIRSLESGLDKQIESYPRVSGGDPMLSRETNPCFKKLTILASKMGDQYVSLEHLLLALVSEKKCHLRLDESARNIAKRVRKRY
jgi:ATP-dependent Clp protease ATP-binding subunit ClpB